MLFTTPIKVYTSRDVRIQLPLGCRLGYETMVLLIVEPAYGTDTRSHYGEVIIPPGATSCRQWNWQGSCDTDTVTQVATNSLAVFTVLYVAWYISYILRAFYQLRRRPCTEVRAASMLLQLQASLPFAACCLKLK